MRNKELQYCHYLWHRWARLSARLAKKTFSVTFLRWFSIFWSCEFQEFSFSESRFLFEVCGWCQKSEEDSVVFLFLSTSCSYWQGGGTVWHIEEVLKAAPSLEKLPGGILLILDNSSPIFRSTFPFNMGPSCSSAGWRPNIGSQLGFHTHHGPDLATFIWRIRGLLSCFLKNSDLIHEEITNFITKNWISGDTVELQRMMRWILLVAKGHI